METIRDYQAIHLLAERNKMKQQPRYQEELSRSVMVQAGEQKPAADSQIYIGVIVYIREDGRVIPGRLDPITYIACVQAAVDRIINQAIDVASTPTDDR